MGRTYEKVNNYLKESFESLEKLEMILTKNNLINETKKLLEVLDSAIQDYDLALTQLEQNHIEH